MKRSQPHTRKKNNHNIQTVKIVSKVHQRVYLELHPASNLVS